MFNPKQFYRCGECEDEYTATEWNERTSENYGIVTPIEKHNRATVYICPSCEETISFKNITIVQNIVNNLDAKQFLDATY